MSDEDLIKKLKILNVDTNLLEVIILQKIFMLLVYLQGKKLKRATCDFTSSVLFQYGEALPKLVDVKMKVVKLKFLQSLNYHLRILKF